jgi:4'-phosphopantetheinyl transferase
LSSAAAAGPAPAAWASARRLALPREDTVHLLRVAVPAPGPELDALHTLLSPAERRRADDKRIPARRHEYVTGQAVLRRVLAHCLGTLPPEIGYRRGHKGKPYLAASAHDDALQFNISHSGGEVMLALTLGAELGVDMEQVNQRTSCERVARRAFSPAERAALGEMSSPAGRRRFFSQWTCKEAVVKCSGDGIHSGMQRYSIALSDDGRRARITEARENQRKVLSYQVVPLPLSENFAAAVVYEGVPRRLALARMSAAELIGAG